MRKLPIKYLQSPIFSLAQFGLCPLTPMAIGLRNGLGPVSPSTVPLALASWSAPQGFREAALSFVRPRHHQPIATRHSPTSPSLGIRDVHLHNYKCVLL